MPITSCSELERGEAGLFFFWACAKDKFMQLYGVQWPMLGIALAFEWKRIFITHDLAWGWMGDDEVALKIFGCKISLPF